MRDLMITKSALDECAKELIRDSWQVASRCGCIRTRTERAKFAGNVIVLHSRPTGSPAD